MGTAEIASALEAPTRIRTGRPTKAAAAARDERLLDIATQHVPRTGLRRYLDGRARRGGGDRQGDALCPLCRQGRALRCRAAAAHPAGFRPHGRGIQRGPRRDRSGDDVAASRPALPRKEHVAGIHRARPHRRRTGVIVFPISPNSSPRKDRSAIFAWSRGCWPISPASMPSSSDDIPMLADLFLSIALGRISRLALYGISIDSGIDGQADRCGCGAYSCAVLLVESSSDREAHVTAPSTIPRMVPLPRYASLRRGGYSRHDAARIRPCAKRWGGGPCEAWWKGRPPRQSLSSLPTLPWHPSR